MKKYLLLLLIITSCASRQTHVEKIDVKKDSVSETKVKVITAETKEKTDSTNINTTIDYNEIVITPIDSSKTIIVDGKSYKNVVLKIKKTKVNNLYTNNKKESNTKRTDSVATTKAVKTEHKTGKLKETNKKANYWVWIWLLLLILILYLLWRNRLRLLRLI